jgi:hypothetical protein
MLRAPQNDVHILRVAHRRLVHARNPRSYGIATGHGVKNMRIVQGARRAKQPSPDIFHGVAHAFP